jgi:mRNA-degrading endonuclease RelE of RelBE toxin-antitoxin system
LLVRIARAARFKKAWEALSERERVLARKAITNLAADIGYPALMTKKMQGTDHIWEARASRSLRITFQIEDKTIILRNIGHHDETLERR